MRSGRSGSQGTGGVADFLGPHSLFLKDFGYYSKWMEQRNEWVKMLMNNSGYCVQNRQKRGKSNPGKRWWWLGQPWSVREVGRSWWIKVGFEVWLIEFADRWDVCLRDREESRMTLRVLAWATGRMQLPLYWDKERWFGGGAGLGEKIKISFV